MIDLNPLANRLDWDLVIRKNLKAQGTTPFSYAPLQPLAVQVDHPITLIGVECPHRKPWWKVGGWASIKFLASPSSTTAFNATMSIESKTLFFGELTLMQFPSVVLDPYLVQVAFPHWLEEVTIEIWKFLKPIEDSNVQLLQQILQQVQVKK